MIIRIKQSIKRKQSIPYIIVFIVYTLTIYISQYYYKDYLFELSLNLTSKINDNTNLHDYLPYFDKFANFLGSHDSYIIIIILVYNSANILKTFILISSMSVVLFIGGILKMVYKTPMMYYSDYSEDVYGKIFPIFCNASWGVPSTHAMSTVIFYLTLWNVVFDCARLRYRKNIKIICLALLIILTIFINFCTFLAALHSLDQILFGTLIGFQIYFFIFYVLKVDLNDGKGLFKIFTFKLRYYLISIICIILTMVSVYYLLPDNPELIKKYEEKINISNCQNKIKFSIDAILLCCIIFSNIGMIIGMKCEYKFIFKNNEMNWRQFNFNKENGEDDSLLSRLSISRESQWNHTSLIFCFLRVICSLVLHIILLIPIYVINLENNILVILILNIIFPLTVSFFLMFCFEKVLLKKWGLTNDAIFRLIDDESF